MTVVVVSVEPAVRTTLATDVPSVTYQTLGVAETDGITPSVCVDTIMWVCPPMVICVCLAELAVTVAVLVVEPEVTTTIAADMPSTTYHTLGFADAVGTKLPSKPDAVVGSNEDNGVGSAIDACTVGSPAVLYIAIVVGAIVVVKVMVVIPLSSALVVPTGPSSVYVPSMFAPKDGWTGAAVDSRTVLLLCTSTFSAAVLGCTAPMTEAMYEAMLLPLVSSSLVVPVVGSDCAGKSVPVCESAAFDTDGSVDRAVPIESWSNV